MKKIFNSSHNLCDRADHPANLYHFFPGVPGSRIALAEKIFQMVFPNIPLSKWSKVGSLIEYWLNNKRIAFAARKGSCSIHFRDRDILQFYKMIGGECETTEVTIQLPYHMNWDPEPVKSTIEFLLYN